MYQRWAELLFLHWVWDPAAVQRTLPRGLTVDTFDGRAWIGLIPFFMQAVRPRFCPTVPGLSDFMELNVRTYVHDAAGRPGVWFYSLDCNQGLAVRLARGLFHLRYEHAVMQAARLRDGGMDYRAQRRGDAHESRLVCTASVVKAGRWRRDHWNFSSWSVTGSLPMTRAGMCCGRAGCRSGMDACALCRHNGGSGELGRPPAAAGGLRSGGARAGSLLRRAAGGRGDFSARADLSPKRALRATFSGEGRTACRSCP
jgi:hypothetical protein